MSAITLFSLTDTLLMSRVCCECLRVAADQTFLYTREPIITPRWSVEVDDAGNRRLVEHWFKNEARES